MRIFVAFPLPENKREPFLELADATPKLPGLKWTPAENLHVTLFFIGEIISENYDEIENRISELCSATLPFHLEFDQLLFAGKPSRSRMIWVRFKESGSFSQFSNLIYEKMRPFMSHPAVHENPIAHITVARLKKGINESSFQLSFPDRFELPKIDTAEIWQTMHGENGVHYKTLVNFKLAGKS